MNRIENSWAGDILCLAVIKGGERYVIMYKAETRAEALRTLGRWASDNRLPFNWADAISAARGIREQT